MNFKILVIGLILGILISCQGSAFDSQKSESPQIAEKEFSRVSYYQTKMKEKNFSFISNGPCDDALGDTLHHRSVPYIVAKDFNDSKATIEFKFKDACCQEFMGDYIITNGTLKFVLEQVNDETCSCICWYRYKLVINNIKEKFSEIEIIGNR